MRFIVFIAFRYFHTLRKSRGITSTILSVAGVAVGVMTLTAVLAVMNGFQLGFIDNILSISSYHIQAFRPDEHYRLSSASDLSSRLMELTDVRAVVPFSEQQVLIRGFYAQERGCLLRGLPADIIQRDPGFSSHLQLVEGSFDIRAPGTIVLGIELARHLGVSSGDQVTMLLLKGATLDALTPARRVYTVSGLFKSGYYEFDLGWAFTALEERDVIRYGIKIRDRFRDQTLARAITAAVSGEYHVETWRSFNRAFFGALRMEKSLMMILIGLIFVVVGFNIYHSLRRTVRERYEEIAVLIALGASSGAIKYIFVLEGLLIGLIGGTLGTITGLAISANINSVFAAAESITNFVLNLVDILFLGRLEPLALFSPSYFYLIEVPSKVLWHEAVLIQLFALFSSTLAALIASKRVAELRPAELLRYE